jgi:hypothetical protein
MPRTSKALAVLDEHETALHKQHATLISQLAGVEASIEMVQDMRKRMAALPKRPSRAKRPVSLPAQPPAAA